jgi:hypothetical protein
LPTPEFEPRTVRPVENRYNDWAIPTSVPEVWFQLLRYLGARRGWVVNATLPLAVK